MVLIIIPQTIEHIEACTENKKYGKTQITWHELSVSFLTEIYNQEFNQESRRHKEPCMVSLDDLLNIEACILIWRKTVLLPRHTMCNVACVIWLLWQATCLLLIYHPFCIKEVMIITNRTSKRWFKSTKSKLYNIIEYVYLFKFALYMLLRRQVLTKVIRFNNHKLWFVCVCVRYPDVQTKDMNKIFTLASSFLFYQIRPCKYIFLWLITLSVWMFRWATFIGHFL